MYWYCNKVVKLGGGESELSFLYYLEQFYNSFINQTMQQRAPTNIFQHFNPVPSPPALQVMSWFTPQTVRMRRGSWKNAHRPWYREENRKPSERQTVWTWKILPTGQEGNKEDVYKNGEVLVERRKPASEGTEGLEDIALWEDRTSGTSLGLDVTSHGNRVGNRDHRKR